ncbi:hypothetical protein [Tenacibaculum ovolyticum]|uniref:hypothetical protein n=1 Tax=Tenacibaculum ovolyticum TaxID=104270 RepID=UPI0003F8B4AF|nr:hypothetical protein [Tenacibaculum ovolyticum]
MKDKQEINITKKETEEAESKNLFLKIWTDSVFSKLIANGILISLPFVSAFIYAFIKSISIKEVFSNFLNLEIKLYALLIISILLILVYYIYLKFNKKAEKQRREFLNKKVGNYRYGDLNNILLTTYIETPPSIRSKTGLKELDLLTYFRLFISYFSSGIDWDYSGTEGVFLYYQLGPKLVSYGLCEMIPSLKSKTEGDINSYDIFTSKEGHLFFALLESFDRVENAKKYSDEMEKMQKKKDKVLEKNLKTKHKN